MSNLKRAIIVIMVVTILTGIITTLSFGFKEGTGDYTEYNCDVKNIRLSTDIEVNINGEYVRRVKGNIFKIVTDPLTLYDNESNKIGYASDEYAIVNQDAHYLRVNKNFYLMDGQFKVFGEKYFIYDEDENYIGRCDFNWLNTRGMIKNANDEVVATYKSHYIFKDFDIKIYENCEIEDDAILMICASYYSDQHYRRSNQN